MYIYIYELYLKCNDKHMFRLYFLKQSSGYNSRIFQYKIDPAFKYEILYRIIRESQPEDVLKKESRNT